MPWVYATIYDRFMAKTERAGLGEVAVEQRDPAGERFFLGQLVAIFGGRLFIGQRLRETFFTGGDC